MYNYFKFRVSKLSNGNFLLSLAFNLLVALNESRSFTLHDTIPLKASSLSRESILSREQLNPKISSRHIRPAPACVTSPRIVWQPAREKATRPHEDIFVPFRFDGNRDDEMQVARDSHSRNAKESLNALFFFFFLN